MKNMKLSNLHCFFIFPCCLNINPCYNFSNYVCFIVLDSHELHSLPLEAVMQIFNISEELSKTVDFSFFGTLKSFLTYKIVLTLLFPFGVNFIRGQPYIGFFS